MSNLVEQIKTAFESEIASELPTFSKLDYEIDVTQNSFRGNCDRYGVIPQSAFVSTGVIRANTLDHTFQVVLTHGYKDIAKNDRHRLSQLEDLYDKMDDISKRVYNGKIGIPSTVLLVVMESMETPEFIGEDKIVVLRGNFLIKYRRNV